MVLLLAMFIYFFSLFTYFCEIRIVYLDNLLLHTYVYTHILLFRKIADPCINIPNKHWDFIAFDYVSLNILFRYFYLTVKNQNVKFHFHIMNSNLRCYFTSFDALNSI